MRNVPQMYAAAMSSPCSRRPKKSIKFLLKNNPSREFFRISSTSYRQRSHRTSKYMHRLRQRTFFAASDSISRRYSQVLKLGKSLSSLLSLLDTPVDTTFTVVALPRAGPQRPHFQQQRLEDCHCTTVQEVEEEAGRYISEEEKNSTNHSCASSCQRVSAALK